MFFDESEKPSSCMFVCISHLNAFEICFSKNINDLSCFNKTTFFNNFDFFSLLLDNYRLHWTCLKVIINVLNDVMLNVNKLESM